MAAPVSLPNILKVSSQREASPASAPEAHFFLLFLHFPLAQKNWDNTKVQAPVSLEMLLSGIPHDPFPLPGSPTKKLVSYKFAPSRHVPVAGHLIPALPGSLSQWEFSPNCGVTVVKL